MSKALSALFVYGTLWRFIKAADFFRLFL